MLIDTHCHLSKKDYDNLDEVIMQMQDNIIITSGTNLKTNKEVLEICHTYSNVYGTIGIHPEEINNIKEDDFKFIEEHINDTKIVGIGEIGLDYYWTKDNKDEQKEFFIRQLKLAQKYNKPVVIHSRDAIQDTYDILKGLNLTIPIDIHCYSSSLEMAREFIKLGAYFGIGGVLTFKNSHQLKDIVSKLDLKYLLLETDSPFLAPEPVRGTKNVPFNTYYIAQKIAEIKGISVDEVLKITSSNASQVFDLNVKL